MAPMTLKHWRWTSEADPSYKLEYPQNPDDQWLYDPEVVPEGWLVKKYTFNSSHSKKVEISSAYINIIGQTTGPKNINFLSLL